MISIKEDSTNRLGHQSVIDPQPNRANMQKIFSKAHDNQPNPPMKKKKKILQNTKNSHPTPKRISTNFPYSDKKQTQQATIEAVKQTKLSKNKENKNPLSLPEKNPILNGSFMDQEKTFKQLLNSESVHWRVKGGHIQFIVKGKGSRTFPLSSKNNKGKQSLYTREIIKWLTLGSDEQPFSKFSRI